MLNLFNKTQKAIERKARKTKNENFDRLALRYAAALEKAMKLEPTNVKVMGVWKKDENKWVN